MNGPKIQGKVIRSIAHDQWARFRKIDLSSVSRVKVSASSGTEGGTLELRAGTPQGVLLGSVVIPGTGGWDKFQEFTIPVTQSPGGSADVVAVFVNPGKGGLMNVDWFEFVK
ncbi:MAG: carbohydrate-binding protein [Verrucomicrobiales bacterium]